MTSPVRGIDISNHQRTVDFDAANASGLAEFVIAKATEGVGFQDGFFKRNWTEAKRVGMVRGAYHFARPGYGNTAVDEAASFLEFVGPLGPGDLLVLDYEDETFHGDPVPWCKAWLDHVAAATGVKPFIYLNLSHMQSDWASVIEAGYALWLASYDGREEFVPQTQWSFLAMKQWTSDGAVPGVSGRCDRNVFYGTRDQLLKYGKQVEAPVSSNDPIYIGQSAAVVTLQKGEVGWITAMFRWPDGRERAVVRKVYAERVGTRPYLVYPPADPDADPTEDLDANPGVFIIAVSDL